MIHTETAEAYHARKAVSAGFLWDMVKPDGCPRQAWFDSVFNPNLPPEKPVREFDIGRAAHLAVLEPDKLMEQICLIDADSYRTKAAQETRAAAYEDGFTPLLAHEYQLVHNLHAQIAQSDAAELLLGDGQSEVSYSWTNELAPRWTVACKARADRITPHALVDLKTAMSAGPEAFQAAMKRDGHHLRAAWYLDGFVCQETDWHWVHRKGLPDYLFVVVAKKPPHLVEVYSLEEHAIQMGRRLYRTALRKFRQCQQTGIWPGYSRKERIGLPTREDYRLAEMEADGELDL